VGADRWNSRRPAAWAQDARPVPRPADTLPPLLLVGAQAALGPHTWPVMLCAGFAGAVLSLRRYAPWPVLALLLAAAVPGAGTPAPWIAAAVALHTVALYRTAGSAAAGCATAALAAAVAAAADGRPPREVAGTALVALGAAAVVWVLGRSHRRRTAQLDALAAFRTGRPLPSAGQQRALH